MIAQNVRSMRLPPRVGQVYGVECVFGTISNIGPHNIPARWWPVFTPSHQDSVYFPRYRTIWNDGEAVDETYYEDDPETPHHHHVDPRFTRDDFYTPYEIENKSFHVTIRPESKVEIREMMCTREMPMQVLFTGFGKNFLDDHKGKKLKGCCKVCPHKGTPLGSMQVVDGKITCPAHGLQFDCKTERCVSEWTSET